MKKTLSMLFVIVTLALSGKHNHQALAQTTTPTTTEQGWCTVEAAPNGNVYAAKCPLGDIFMQTAGTGSFVALGQKRRNWTSLSAAPNGNVYATAGREGIFLQVNGVGNFIQIVEGDPVSIPLPSIQMTANPANIHRGSSSDITWTSQNAKDCITRGGANNWAGLKSHAGDFHTGSLYETTTFELACKNDYGSVTGSITIFIMGK